MQFTMNPYTESTLRGKEKESPIPWFGTGATTALSGCKATFVDCEDLDKDGEWSLKDCELVEKGGDTWISPMYGGNTDDGLKLHSMDQLISCKRPHDQSTAYLPHADAF